jgi:hypothetical protein
VLLAVGKRMDVRDEWMVTARECVESGGCSDGQ